MDGERVAGRLARIAGQLSRIASAMPRGGPLVDRALGIRAAYALRIQGEALTELAAQLRDEQAMPAALLMTGASCRRCGQRRAAFLALGERPGLLCPECAVAMVEELRETQGAMQ